MTNLCRLSIVALAAGAALLSPIATAEPTSTLIDGALTVGGLTALCLLVSRSRPRR